MEQSTSPRSKQPETKEIPEGNVSFASVVYILEQSAADGGFSFACNGQEVTIVAGGLPEVYLLPDPVTRRMVARLSHKYKIRIEYFYKPELRPWGANKPHIH